MTDLFDRRRPARRKFRDGPTRYPAVAERKAVLCWEVGRRCRSVPPCMQDASVQAIRLWEATITRALVLLAKPYPTRHALEAVLFSLQWYD